MSVSGWFRVRSTMKLHVRRYLRRKWERERGLKSIPVDPSVADEDGWITLTFQWNNADTR